MASWKRCWLNSTVLPRPDPPPKRERGLGSRSATLAGMTVYLASGAMIGGRELTVIAGPCSVEGAEMLGQVARGVQASGAAMLRGGAFKPRTSPYAFQGLGPAALRMLSDVRAATGLPVVT